MNLNSLLPAGLRRSDEFDPRIVEMLRHNPIGVLHTNSADACRRIYSESCSYQLAPNMRSALRRMTLTEEDTAQKEIDALPHGTKTVGNSTYTELLQRKAHGLIAAGDRQLVLELDRSGLCAVKVPAGAQCSALDSLMRAGGDTAPCIESACRTYTTLLFARPTVDNVVRRRLVVDPLLDAVRPDDDQVNAEPLPHAGTLERWVRLGAAPELPAELHSQLTSHECEVRDSDVAEWVEKHYRAAKRGEKGTTREAVHAALLGVNGWVPSDYPAQTLSRAIQLVSFFDSKRGAAGIRWMIERNERPLTSLRGVSVETLDVAELAAFRAWRASREMSPQRRRERAEHAAAVKAAAERAAMIAAKYGSEEVLEILSEQQPCPGMLNPTAYVHYHVHAERQREQACNAMATEFKPLPFVDAEPSWWALSPPGTKHDARYRRLIAVKVRGEA